MSSGNNTIVPLPAGGVFTGIWEKRNDLAVLSVNFYTNKGSTLVVEQSTNGSTAINAQTFGYTAGPAKIFQQYLVLEYFRIIVTNTSAESQAYLRVSSRLSNVVAPFSGDVSGAVEVTNFADLVTDLSGVFVHVDNFPATQAVSGEVSVSNFPATQPVSIADPVPVTGDFYQVTQPISGSITLLPAADPSLCVGKVRITDAYGDYILTTSGNLMVGINNIYTSNPLHTIVDSATGTTLAYTNIALSNTGQVVYAAPSTIRQFSAQNSNATAQYIKIYNKANAATFADTPIFTFFLPGGSGVDFELNHLFSIGISVRATFLPAVADNTAAADYVFTNFTYTV